MNNEPRDIPQADPASHDPSEGRAAACAGCGGTGQAQTLDRTDRYLLVLDRLTDRGMELVELLMAKARREAAVQHAAPEAEPAPSEAAPDAVANEPAEPNTVEPQPTPEQRVELDPAFLAFQRITRAIRLCMALAIRLQNDRLDRAAGIVKGRAPPKPPRARSPKEQLEHLVEEAIERGAERDEKEVLLSELRERLEEDDIERDLELYAPEELVVRICQELGAGPDGEFSGMGTYVLHTVIIDPPPRPGEPFREQLPPEIVDRLERPTPLHVLRKMKRKKPPSG